VSNTPADEPTAKQTQLTDTELKDELQVKAFGTRRKIIREKDALSK